MKSPREWFELSKKHPAKFFHELGKLAVDDIEKIVRSVSDLPPEGSLRSLADIRGSRTEIPDLDELATWEPKELTLQWTFMHREYLTTKNEQVIAREIPISPAGVQKVGWCDLLVFDQGTSTPILVELKRADATDSLSGVLFEVLFHWAFHKSHFVEFREQLDADGLTIPKTVTQPGAAIAAPGSYYAEAQRRSDRRNGEYEIALSMMNCLRERMNLDVRLLVIDEGWQEAGLHFDIVPWTQGLEELSKERRFRCRQQWYSKVQKG